MAHRAGLLLIALDGVGGLRERRVAQRGDDAVLPVEVLGSHARGRVFQILRRFVDVRVERHQRVERVGAVGDPLDRAVRLRTVRANLHDGQLALAVDADRAVHVACVLVAEVAVRVERRALIVRAEHVLYVLDRHLALGLTGPRDVIAVRAVVGLGAVPHLVVRVEEPLHDPCARRVVHVIRVGVRAEGITRVERRRRFDGQIKVIALDEFDQILGAHVVLLLTEGVIEVEFVDAELVRHRHIRFVGHALGDPVMATDGFHPPNLVGVRERDTVHLIGAVFLKKVAKPLHALTRGGDVRQHDGQEVLLADAAGHGRLVIRVTFPPACRPVFHKRVGAEHALVGGQRFGGAHGHVRLVDAGLAPDAFLQVGVRHCGVLQRIVGQVNGQVADDAAVFARLFIGLDDDEPLRVEFAVGGILVAGDDGRTVIAGVLADQNRGACHSIRYCPFLLCTRCRVHVAARIRGAPPVT